MTSSVKTRKFDQGKSARVASLSLMYSAVAVSFVMLSSCSGSTIGGNSNCSLLVDGICIQNDMGSAVSSYNFSRYSDRHSKTYFFSELMGDGTILRYVVTIGIGSPKPPEPGLCELFPKACDRETKEIKIRYILPSDREISVFYTVPRFSKLDAHLPIQICQEVGGGGNACDVKSIDCYTHGLSKICYNRPSAVEKIGKLIRKMKL